MGFYSRQILPKLIDFAMTREEIMRLRAVHVPAARGVVLEVGIGSGLNLPFYTRAVRRLYGIDPSSQLADMARRRAASVAFAVDLILGSADRIPLDTESVDSCVVTWSLCSVVDPEAVLAEMRRVLKRRGTLIFAEHGLAPDAGVRKWQNRITPVWRRFAGGCHLNRRVDDLIREAGFQIDTLVTEYLQGPRALTFTYAGSATRPES